MAFPLVCVIILNWKDSEATFACLRALAGTGYPNLCTVVVDNGSTDGSVETLARMDSVNLIRNGRNLGFTGGVNVGLRHAVSKGADYVWMLNSDATVQPDVLGKLVAAAESDPRIGLVSPVFHDPDVPDVPEFCLGRFDPAARYATQTADVAQAKEWQANHPDQVLLLGTALLVRRSLIEAIGGLDEGFFAYVEDVDYCLRSLKAGFRNVAVPDAVVYHKFKQPVTDPAACPPYLHYFMSRNYLLLWKKLPGSPLLQKAAVWFLRQRLVQLDRMRDQPAAVDALLAGLWDGVRGRTGPYDPGRRMPWPVRVLLERHPGALIRLLDGKLPFGPKAA
jgi:GT2 family glycosyltransferase